MMLFLRRFARHVFLTTRELAVHGTRHRLVPAVGFFAMRLLTPFGLFKRVGDQPSADNAIVARLNTHALAEMPPLSDAQVDSFAKHFVQTVDASAGRRYDDLASYFAHYRQDKNQRPPALYATGKLDCPLTRLTLNEELLSIASRYMGVDKNRLHCLTHMDALIRIDGEAKKAAGNYDFGLQFHRDVDGYRFLKMFFYLTDCFEGDGHHEIYVGTHLHNPISLGPIARYESSEIEAAIPGAHIQIVQGKAGFAFAEDTYAFHRGTKPKKNDRLILSLQYMTDSFADLFPNSFPAVAAADR